MIPFSLAIHNIVINLAILWTYLRLITERMDPLSISLAVLPIVASCVAAIAKLRTVLESTKAINGTLLELLTRAERMRLFLDALHSLCAQIRDQVQESFLLDFDKTGCIMTINSLKQLVETVVDDSKKNRYWMKLHWALLKPDAVALIHDLGERQRDINSVIILIAACVFSAVADIFVYTDKQQQVELQDGK